MVARVSHDSSGRTARGLARRLKLNGFTNVRTSASPGRSLLRADLPAPVGPANNSRSAPRVQNPPGGRRDPQIAQPWWLDDSRGHAVPRRHGGRGGVRRPVRTPDHPRHDGPGCLWQHGGKPPQCSRRNRPRWCAWQRPWRGAVSRSSRDARRRPQRPPSACGHAHPSRSRRTAVRADPYVKPTQQGIICHMRALAHASDRPLVLYDVPGRVGAGVADATLAVLFERDIIGGIKDATADIARVPRLRALCGPDLLQFSGDDATAAAHRAMGGRGCISVTANVAPALCALLHQAWDVGDLVAFATTRSNSHHSARRCSSRTIDPIEGRAGDARAGLERASSTADPGERGDDRPAFPNLDRGHPS